MVFLLQTEPTLGITVTRMW